MAASASRAEHEVRNRRRAVCLANGPPPDTIDNRATQRIEHSCFVPFCQFMSRHHQGSNQVLFEEYPLEGLNPTGSPRLRRIRQ